jgi:hypothetical protein
MMSLALNAHCMYTINIAHIVLLYCQPQVLGSIANVKSIKRSLLVCVHCNCVHI